MPAKKSLTPDELMLCRVCLAVGKLPSEVLDAPSTDFDLLERYYVEEPWGSWRDNLHAAIIAREVLKANGFKVPKLDVFMVKGPARRDAEEKAARQGVFAMMKAIAVRKRRTKTK